jgi:hypothetical protein
MHLTYLPHNPALNRTCAKSRAGRLAPRWTSHIAWLKLADRARPVFELVAADAHCTAPMRTRDYSATFGFGATYARY